MRQQAEVDRDWPFIHKNIGGKLYQSYNTMLPSVALINAVEQDK